MHYRCYSRIICLSTITMCIIFTLVCWHSYNFTHQPQAVINPVKFVEPVLTEENIFQLKLREVEQIWRDGIKLRNISEDIVVGNSPYHPFHYKGVIIWDYYYPTFNCPHIIERIGRIGSGRMKTVCGMSQLAKKGPACVVYSYGIANDSSFEEEILERTLCKVRMYDSNLSVNQFSRLLEKFPSRITFKKLSIGNDLRTLKTEMRLNGDTFIHILNIDIGGGEYGSLPQIVQDFPKGLPFGQLLIQIHLNSINWVNMYLEFKIWWEEMEASGMRPFSNEPNLYVYYNGSKHPSVFDYSFLNVIVDHVILHA